MVECTVPRSQTLHHYLLQWQDLKTQDNIHFKSVNIFCKLYMCIFRWHTLIGNTGNLLKQICDLGSVKIEHCSCFAYLLLHFILEERKIWICKQVMCSWPKRVTHSIASVCYFWFWTCQEGRETVVLVMTKLNQQFDLYLAFLTFWPFQDWLSLLLLILDL